MPEPLTFPAGFLWGAATAAHQVEGANTDSDWWQWETDPAPRVRLAEPSGTACDHLNRYADDIALLAGLGLNTYRFSVEWARVEPRAGEFDAAALDHYAAMVDACLAHGVEPVVTLHHFTLPAWVARAGSWLNDDMPFYFARYVRAVVDRIGDRVRWFCTINEPGNLISRGFLGAAPTAPFVADLDAHDRAAATVNAAHRLARDVIKDRFPQARVGMAHALNDWRADEGGQPLLEWAREIFEDRYFAETAGDDFIGVQTYTIIEVNAPRAVRPVAERVLRSRALTRATLLPILRHTTRAIDNPANADGRRRTAMGWLWAPESVEPTTRRVAALFPGKDLLLTEHGVATDDDAERIEYLGAGLTAVHRLVRDGLPVRGYWHWSLLDNFEWTYGYRPKFGLIAVDRATQERTVKPSARWYGEVAKANRLG